LRSWRAWREAILVPAEGRAGFISVHLWFPAPAPSLSSYPLFLVRRHRPERSRRIYADSRRFKHRSNHRDTESTERELLDIAGIRGILCVLCASVVNPFLFNREPREHGTPIINYQSSIINSSGRRERRTGIAERNEKMRKKDRRGKLRRSAINNGTASGRTLAHPLSPVTYRFLVRRSCHCEHSAAICRFTAFFPEKGTACLQFPCLRGRPMTAWECQAR